MTSPEPGSARQTRPTLADVLTRAIARHQRVRESEARRICLAILAADAEKFDALNYFGVLEAQQGHYVEADCLLVEALAIRPGSAEACLNYGNVLNALDRPGEALASYDKALAARPQYPEALYCRANALQRLNRHEEALASYDAALAFAPDRAEVLTNRGNTLHDLGRHEEALASYDRALALAPEVAMLHSNRGNALRDLGRHAEALASLDRALALDPEYLDARGNRGNVLRDMGRFPEALAEFDRALARDPRAAVLHGLRAGVLHDLNRHDAAAAGYRRALELDPAAADVLCGYAMVLRDFGRYDDMLACLDRALAVKPDDPRALNNRAQCLGMLRRHEEAARDFSRLLSLAPDWDYALGGLFHSRQHCCDWTDHASRARRLVEAVMEGRNKAAPFVFLAASESAAAQLRCARTYAADKYPAHAPLWSGERYTHERVRVAYVSADFHEHPVSRLMAGVFEGHDRQRFEIIGISLRPGDGSATDRRVRAALGEVVEAFGMADARVAALLREQEIDIAVDLNGFTAGNRTGIFAFRGAPVQVNYLGYPGTMGADYIDYILADRIVIPEQHRAHYTEQVAYLPDSYMANDSGRVIAEHAPTRVEVGLPESGFVFCSFNESYKLTPDVFDVWMRLLGRIEGSVLWLRGSSKETMRNLRGEAARRGIAPERLVFATRTDRIEDHLARHRLADLSLDTLPYNAHATTSDALWAGLPVVTCLGNTFAGRVGASLLDAIGLNELITRSLEEYEALAVELATNPERLAGIRAKLVANRTTYPLFDTNRFRRHLEAAYTTMWERCQRGEPPASFAVSQ